MKNIATSLQLITANGLGALGYISLLFQWLWVVLLYGPLLLDSPIAPLFLPAEAPEPAPEPIVSTEPSIFLFIIAAGITVVILALSIYVIAKLPAAIGKTGNKVTRSTAEFVLPAITKHAPISPKRKRVITTRIVHILKALLCGIPLVSLLFVQLIDPLPLEYSIVLAVGITLAGATAVLFILQYVFARLFRIKSENVW